jgi:hypothetical protein
LDARLIESLLAPAKRQPAKLAFVNGAWEDIKLTKDTVGAHEGRAGTVVRTRKGATRRMPNGRRFYNDYEMIVDAYMAAKVVK